MGDALLGSAAKGAVAGAVGTVAMSAVMLAAQQVGVFSKQPPETLTEAALEEAGAEPVDEQAENALSTAAHLGFGSATGAAFALADRVVAGRVHPALWGPVFGLGVWTLAYKGVIPRLGLLPHPDDDQPGRPATMIGAHLVWGATTGWVVGRTSGR